MDRAARSLAVAEQPVAFAAVRGNIPSTVICLGLLGLTAAAGLAALLTAQSYWLPVALLATGVLGMVAVSRVAWWGLTSASALICAVALAAPGVNTWAGRLVWALVLVATLGASRWAFSSRRKAAEVVSYLQARARHESVHDELTGLLNRRGAEVVAAGLMDFARRDSDAVSAALICVEDDGLGMTAEERDDALLSAAEAAGGVFRGSDVLARVSGDCLLVVAKGSGLNAALVQSRMDTALELQLPTAGPVPVVTVGSATLPPWDEGTLADLFEQARRDLMMKWAVRQQELGTAGSSREIAIEDGFGEPHGGRSTGRTDQGDARF